MRGPEQKPKNITKIGEVREDSADSSSNILFEDPVARMLAGLKNIPWQDHNTGNNPVETPEAQGKKRMGFASMLPEKVREIASKGGKEAHEQGTAHEFNPEEARKAGRKGGEKVSRDREHMRIIGRKGGSK